MTKKFMVLVLLAIAVIAAVPGIGICESKGNHYGETKQIEAVVEFGSPEGTCVVDGTGITYYYQGEVYPDSSIIYPSIYWGEYPFYFPGGTVPTAVTITNSGPRAVAKHDLVTEANYINPDGSIGGVFLPPLVQNIEVSLGETKVIDASFTLPSSTKPGLDIFSVKLYHHYNVDSPYASLVIKFDGVFCPPEVLQ